MARAVLKARRAASRHLPPYMPRDEVELLPFFGRTWYVRGAGYYFRRAVQFLLLLVGVVVATTLEYGMFHGLDRDSSGARIIVRVLVVAAAVVSFIWPIRQFLAEERRRRAGEIVYPNYIPGLRRTMRAVAGVGNLAAAGNTAAGALLVLSAVCFYGWFWFLLIGSMRREFGVEHDARLRMQQRHPRA